MVCAGPGNEWIFADVSEITSGGNFKCSIPCWVVGTSSVVEISVQELQEKTSYKFEVVKGDYAITAVNLRVTDGAKFCSWCNPVLQTGVLSTPIYSDKYKCRDLVHVDICVKKC